MAKARDIMTAAVEVVAPEESVQRVARLMAEKDLGAVPVCAGGGLKGMLTDRDIAIQVVAAGKDPAQTRVGDITEVVEVVTIGADDILDEALLAMKEHRVRRLPVIDGHQLVGVISQGDLANGLPESKVGDLIRAISAAA